MIVRAVSDVVSAPIFIELDNIIPQSPVFVKLEGLNIAGSIKLKTAKQIILDLRERGILQAGSQIIESSSGNLGLALAIVSLEQGYSFTCVSDPMISPMTEKLLKALGANVIIVNVADSAGGYLEARLKTIKRLLKENPRLVWTNQYANLSNSLAHYLSTGPEILASFPSPNYVFIGAGTTGTLMGCARYIREKSPLTRIVAVDPVGSVTFGGRPGCRHLPGIGTSRRPELADESLIDEVVYVPEVSAVRMCRAILRRNGLMLGASSGSVLSAVALKQDAISAGDTVVAVSADFGDRYYNTLYDDGWVTERFGDAWSRPADEIVDRHFHHVDESVTRLSETGQL